MSEPTSRRPAHARLLDRAVRILAVAITASRNYGVNSPHDDGQKWAGREIDAERRAIMNA